MTDWMSKLTKDIGILASEIPDATEQRILLPSPSFNWAVNGGLVEGKVATFYGPESGGKSLLMQLGMIEIQKKYPDGICILFDAEYSFNPKWFAKLGGDLDRLVVRKSNDPTKIFDYIYGEMYKDLQDGAPIKCIGIDSIKSIAYPGDIKDVSTQLTMGGSGAKYLSGPLKRIIPVIREFNILTILVQQVYMELDQMKAMRNPYKVPDGNSLKHCSDYMIQVDKLETKAGSVEGDKKDIMGKNIQIGHKVRMKCKKNRTGAPYRVAEFTLDYDKGIIRTDEEIFELAKNLGKIYHPVNPSTGKENTQMWQFANYDPIRGEDACKAWLKDSSKIQEEVIKSLYEIDNTKIESINSKIEDVEVELD